MPDAAAAKTSATTTTTSPSLQKKKAASASSTLDRLAEESFAIHMKHGSEFVDENPITGRPGEFHLSSTGRKDKASTTTAGGAQTGKAGAAAAPALNTKVGEDPKKGGKSPKTPTMPKPKRRKSKIAGGAAA